jgi:hypothetical protein
VGSRSGPLPGVLFAKKPVSDWFDKCQRLVLTICIDSSRLRNPPGRPSFKSCEPGRSKAIECGPCFRRSGVWATARWPKNTRSQVEMKPQRTSNTPYWGPIEDLYETACSGAVQEYQTDPGLPRQSEIQIVHDAFSGCSNRWAGFSTGAAKILCWRA